VELLRVREGQREGGAITGPTGGRRGEEREVPAHTMDARLTGSKHSSLTKIKASEFFFVLFFLSTGLFFIIAIKFITRSKKLLRWIQS